MQEFCKIILPIGALFFIFKYLNYSIYKFYKAYHALQWSIGYSSPAPITLPLVHLNLTYHASADHFPSSSSLPRSQVEGAKDRKREID